MDTQTVTSGLPDLDAVVQGLRLGDNVVWQVDHLDDYLHFARPFAARAIADGRRCAYMRFAPHAPILEPVPGLTLIEVNPHDGFDAFSGEVHRIIESLGKEAFYVFDNLSALVDEWATDELLANFFQLTCPFLYELDTVAFFALTRGHHAHSAVARIRDTTQVLIDVYRVRDETYIHPLKVWARYSPQMFLPHVRTEEGWSPVFQSGDAAAIDCKIRGLSPFPGAWFEAPSEKGPVRVKALLCRREAGCGAPGDLLDDDLLVACGEGAVRLLRVQREGKGPQEAEVFLRGFPLKRGTRLA